MAYSSEKFRESLGAEQKTESSKSTQAAASNGDGSVSERFRESMGISMAPAKTWADSYNGIIQKYNSYNTQRNGSWTKDVTGGTLSGMKSLIDRYATDAHDNGSFGGAYQQLVDLYNSSVRQNEFMSQFKDADHYDAYRSNYFGNIEGYDPTAFGLADGQDMEMRQRLHESNQAKLDEMQPGLLDAKRRYLAAQSAFEAVTKFGSTDVNDLQLAQEYPALQEEYQRIQSEADYYAGANQAYTDSGMERSDGTWQIRQTDAWKNTDTTYRGPTASYIIGENMERQQQVDLTGVDPGSQAAPIRDKLGIWMNASEEERKMLTDAGVWSTIAREAADNDWGMLNQNEIQTYYYLLNNSGEESANSYLDSMARTLNYRANQEQIAGIQKITDGHPVAAALLSLASTLPSVFGSLTSAGDTAGKLARGEDLNEYAHGLDFSRTASNIRAVVGNNLNQWASEKYGDALGKYAANTYQAIMSGIDSAVGAKIFGASMKFEPGDVLDDSIINAISKATGGRVSIAAGTPIGESAAAILNQIAPNLTGYTGVMAGGAFSNRAIELAKSGASEGQIWMGALGAGAIEAFTENAGIDNIVNRFGKERFITEMLRNTASEAMEEGLSDVLNLAWDAMVRGESSDHSREIHQLMYEQGMSYDEARVQAAKDAAVDLFWSMYGGAISGGAMTAGAGALGGSLNGLANMVDNYGTGQDILNSGTQWQLMEQARGLTDAKKSAKLQKQAGKVSGLALDEDGKAGFFDSMKTGKVANQIRQQAANEYADSEKKTFREAAKKYIDASDIRNKSLALDTVMRMQFDETLLPGQRGYFRQIGGQKLIDAIVSKAGGQEAINRDAGIIRERSERTFDNVGSIQRGVDIDRLTNDHAYASENTGVPIVKETKEPVEIRGISQVAGGKMYLDTDQGTIEAGDISYGNDGQALMYSVVSSIAQNTTQANEIMGAFEASDMDSATFARAARNAFLQGRNGVAFDSIKSYSFAAKLDNDIRRQIWEAGAKSKQQTDRGKQAALDKGRHGKAKGGLKHDGFDPNTANLNEKQKTALDAANVLAAFGMDITVYASTEAQRAAGVPNGEYNTETGELRFDINSGMDGSGMAAFTLAHEFTHHIQEFAPQEFEKFASILFAQTGVDAASLLEQKEAMLRNDPANAKKTDQKISDLAYAEAVAEACETMFTDTDVIAKISNQLQQQDKSLWDKIADWLRGLVDRLRNAYKGVDPDSDIARQMRPILQQNEALLDAYVNAAVTAVEQFDTLSPSAETDLEAEQKNIAPDGTMYMSRGNKSPEILSIKNQISEAADQLNSMDPVVNVNTIDLSSMNTNQRYKWAIGVLKQTGYQVDRNGFGVIKFTERQINTGLNYLNTAEEVSAFAALPRVLKRGIVVSKNDNHKFRNFGTITIAAPVVINGVRGNMAVAVQMTSDNHYHTHRILMPDGSAFVFEKNTALTPARGSDINAHRASPISAVSNDNIQHPDSNVKPDRLHSSRNSNGEQLSPAQQEYFKDSKVRDANGNLMVMYRGGKDDFTVFDRKKSSPHNLHGRGFYFTSSESHAKTYGDAKPYYLNITNPLMPDQHTITRSQMRKFIQAVSDNEDDYGLDNYGYGATVSSVLSDIWGKGDYEMLSDINLTAIGDMVAAVGLFNEVNGTDYDGLILPSETVTFQSNQAKNVDNNNPTRDPDIRYSTRMSAETKAAIEAYKAQMDAVSNAQKAVYEAERKQILREYKAKTKALEASYSAEIEDIQNAFLSVVRNYEAKTLEAGAQAEMIDELTEALRQEVAAHDVDKETWDKEFSRLLKEYNSLKGKSETAVKDLEQKLQQQRETARARVESRHKTEMRHKIQDTVDTLNRYLLHPTKDIHVPESMQASVKMAMQAINGAMMSGKSAANVQRLAAYHAQLAQLEQNYEKNQAKIAEINGKIQRLTSADTKMKDALGRLQQEYRNMTDSGEFLFDDVIAEKIKEAFDAIGETEYNNLSMQQLEAVHDAYKAILTQIRNRNKSFRAGAKQTIDQMYSSYRREMLEKPQQGKFTSVNGKMRSQFLWNNLKPVYAFDRIGSKTLSSLYNELRKGEDTWYRDVSDAKSYFMGTAAKYGYDTWDMNKMFDFESTTGEKFQLNLSEVMSLYAYSLRPQARGHLNNGGIVLNENTERTTTGFLGMKRNTIYNDANAYNLSNETIDSISGMLTVEQRAFAREMQRYLSDVMGAKGNEVSMQLYDIKLYKEQFYWPLKPSGRFSERAKESQQNPLNKMKNSGFTYATVQNASNPVELSGFMETWTEHVNKMSMYHAFTLPMEDFYRVYNHRSSYAEGTKAESAQVLLENACGSGAVRYIDQFLMDLNGGLRADPRETVEKALVSKFKKGAVFASASVAIQQPSAVGRAFSVISPVYFVGGRIENEGKTWEQLKKYAPVAGLKEMGRFDMDMGKSTEEYIMGGNHGFLDKVDNVLGWAPEKADEITWVAIWEAAKRQTAAHHPGIKGEDLLQKAGDLFTECITRTQVYDSVFSRSANMRSKATGMSMVTAFMAEPTTTANMIENAIRQWSRGDKRGASKAVASVLASITINSLLAALVYAARDDDEDKTYLEKYTGEFVSGMTSGLNPITYIPLAKDIWSLFQGYDVDRADMALYADAASALTRARNVAKKYRDDFTDEEMQEWLKEVRDAGFRSLDAVAAFAGLPVKNLRRDVNAAWNLIANKSNWAESSGITIWNAAKESFMEEIPLLNGLNDESKTDKLYNAILSGDRVSISRAKSRFDGAQKLDTAMVTALKDNDPRIMQAARAMVDGDNATRIAISRQIIAEGNFSQNQVIRAINSEISKLTSTSKDYVEKEQSLYDASDYLKAITAGIGSADAMHDEIVRAKVENKMRGGETDLAKATEAAESSFRSSIKQEVNEAFADGSITDKDAMRVLIQAGIYNAEDAEKKVTAWSVLHETGDRYEWTDTRCLQFRNTMQPAGFSADAWDQFVQGYKNVHGEDKNGDGKTDAYSKMYAFIAFIDSLPLTPAQKDLLLATEYDSKKALKARPWK